MDLLQFLFLHHFRLVDHKLAKVVQVRRMLPDNVQVGFVIPVDLL